MSGKTWDLLNSIVNGHIDNFEVDIEEGKLKGENFLGDLVFVSLKNKHTKEIINVVVKQALEDMCQLTFFNSAYEVEIKFYEKIWPTLNKFQEEHSIGFNKIPKCYTTCHTKGNEKLILEDIRSQGFKLCDKTKPIDMEHYEFMFKNYGVYHAISYAFKQLHPEEFTELVNFLYKTDTDSSNVLQRKKTMFDSAVRSLEYVQNLFDCNKDKAIYEMLEKHKQHPFRLFEPLYTHSKENDVILHGDCWSNNVMFKYDDSGHIEDMRLLDFQLVQTGSIVNDLCYCLYSGASKETMDNYTNLLKIYIKSFSETLEKFNCKPEKPYTLQTLESEWKKFAKMGFMQGINLWRVKLADKDNISQLKSNTDESFGLVAKEHIEDFHKRLKELTIHFYENCFL